MRTYKSERKIRLLRPFLLYHYEPWLIEQMFFQPFLFFSFFKLYTFPSSLIKTLIFKMSSICTNVSIVILSGIFDSFLKDM